MASHKYFTKWPKLSQYYTAMVKIPKHVVFLNKVLNRCNLNYDDWQNKTCYTSLHRNVNFTCCAITAKFLISKGHRVILTSGKLNTFINERHS